ncbi:MAG TPA: carbon monoxide dehydrogenase subunit G [Streptosporangiaceae bacterium]|jgi:hypothetical protein
MKVTGEATVGAPAETVWAALHDRAVLVRAVPGCERLEVTGPGSGRFIVTTELAAVSGTYSGQFTASGEQRPSFVELAASASGAQGTVTADLTLRLTPTEGGATLVSYEANGVADGAIAAVGARLLASAAKRLADEFLAGLDEELAEPAEPASVPAKNESGPAASGPAATSTAALVPAAGSSPEPVGQPVSPGSSLIARLDRRTSALIGAAILLGGIVLGILLGRRGRRDRTGRS